MLMKWRRDAGFIFIFLCTQLFSGCTPAPIKVAEMHSARGDWTNAVRIYRKLATEYPDDVEYRSRLKQAELKAADFYYQQGIKFIEAGDFERAMGEFQQGLLAMPDHDKLKQASTNAMARKEAERLIGEALQNKEAGKYKEAVKLIENAMRLYPEHERASDLLFEINALDVLSAKKKLVLGSKQPISLNFHSAPIRTAFEFVSKSFGINIIFDEDIKSTPVSITAKDVTFEQALNLMMTTTKTFYKQLGDNTILIAPDTKDKRGQYEDYLIRTYQLNTIRVKDMENIIKGLLRLKDVYSNEQLNTLYVRGTSEMLTLVDNVVALNDRKPAELVLDVEILEVNRNKAEQLGFDWGSIITQKYKEFSGSWGNALNSGTVTLPATTFRFFKQDVDAKTLANPKVRVVSSKTAKIHIGDRIPLRSATIQDTTGQVRTTFTYTDVGIKLIVEPIIHLDNSATVKLNLEVSSLGQDLGTPTEPAYSIGTRNADTSMLLRDGETAILGGLIKDEDRKNVISVPGLGEVPLVGSLFRTNDTGTNRTDVLLTITPRIVRGWDIPSKLQREFYSGTQDNFATKAKFAYMKERATGNEGEPQIAMGDNGGATPPIDKAQETPSTAQGDTPMPAAIQPAGQKESERPILSFAKSVYEVKIGEEFDVQLMGSQLKQVSSLPMQILFNAQLLDYTKSEQGGSHRNANVNKEADGVLNVNVDVAPGSTQDVPLANVKLRGTKSGVSYLVYRVPALTTATGETISAHVRASRIVIH